MKKITTLTIAALSIFVLAACSNQKSDSDMKKTDDSSMMKKDDMKKTTWRKRIWKTPACLMIKWKGWHEGTLLWCPTASLIWKMIWKRMIWSQAIQAWRMTWKIHPKCHLTNSNSTIGKKVVSFVGFLLILKGKKNDEEVINIDYQSTLCRLFGSLFKSEDKLGSF